jgi:hypothetical protein
LFGRKKGVLMETRALPKCPSPQQSANEASILIDNGIISSNFHLLVSYYKLERVAASPPPQRYRRDDANRLIPITV